MKTAPHIFMIPAIYVIDHVTLLTTKLANMLTPLGAPDAIVAFSHESYRLAFALSTWAFLWHMTPSLARFMIKLLHGIIAGVAWLESAFDALWMLCRKNLRRLFVWCARTIGDDEPDQSKLID